MSATIESDIATALFDHLENASGLWPISWPNMPFKPPTNGRYLAVTFQPNETASPFLEAGTYRYQGLLQVSIIDKPNKGIVNPMLQAASVVAHFEYLTAIPVGDDVMIVSRQPSVAPGIQTKSTYEVPVTISYLLQS